MKIVFVLVALLFSGCATTPQVDWAIDMQPVRQIKGLQVRVSHQTGYWMSVDVTNTSGSMAKLVWDDSSVVGSNGQSSRAIRGETRKIATSSSQPASPIPPGASLKAGFIGERFVDAAALTRIRPPEGTTNPRIRVVLAFDVDGQRSYHESEGRFRKLP